MKIGIMQPYFLPYIGYFQLMASVDKFVLYDNIEYTKKGWINRNRILVNNTDSYVSLPLKNDSDYLHVNERCFPDTFNKDCLKIKRKIQEAYIKAPFFKEVYPLIEDILNFGSNNLFEYIYNSIKKIHVFLDIKTELIISSNLNIDTTKYRGQDKVIAICESLSAGVYINTIGGIEIYQDRPFSNKGIRLLFIKSNDIEYKQFNDKFIPWLSIIDILMFNGKEKVKLFLQDYTLQRHPNL